MRFRIPGKSVHIRIMEPVVTEDTQYHIFDTGVDYADGTVASIAIPGAFATVKRPSANTYANSMKKAAQKAKMRANHEPEYSMHSAEEPLPVFTGKAATVAH